MTELADLFAEPFLIAMGFLVVFMAMAMLRVLLGPTVADRAVALDTINTLVVASLILGGAAFDEPSYIVVAIVYAFLSFTTTLFIANYLEGGEE
jgi:multicomponent Na+:H+ antiporter subunit F